MMYLYALIDRPEPPVLHQQGLEEADLLHCAYQGIAAVVSPFAGSRVQPSEDNLWRHEQVVEALMVECTVLPVRFGTLLADRAAVQAALATHYSDWMASLDRVRGRAELSVRVLWDGDDEPPLAPFAHDGQSHPESGRSYLMARLEQERQARLRQHKAEKVAAELHTTLAHLAADSIYQVLITPRMLLTAAYLVERTQMTAFQHELEALRVAHPALRFLCTGPWPPYNFVTAGTMLKGEKEQDVHF